MADVSVLNATMTLGGQPLWRRLLAFPVYLARFAVTPCTWLEAVAIAWTLAGVKVEGLR